MLNEEMSKLREYLGSTEKELSDLRRLLDKELKDKIEKRNAAERKAATDKQMATIKQMHIDQLMLDIAEKDKTIKAMQEELELHARTKKQQADKSLRDVDTLKKRLQDEKKLKKIAIHKVDDLLSQVYEYETAFAITQTGGRPSGPVPTRTAAGEPVDAKKVKNISQSGCRKFRTTAVSYEDLLRRFPIPYTPDHYLNHRRQMVTIPRLQQQLAHEILGGQPPATHAAIAEAQETEKEEE
nr:unnamed protein product [Spirometra erinaceieuropaei]